MSSESIEWGEIIPHPDEAVFSALLVIAIRLDVDLYQALGTGFVWNARGNKADAITAAHVFEEIYNTQNPSEPRPVNHLFDPDTQQVDLDPDKVFAICFIKGRAHVLKIFNLYYEVASDFAMFSVAKVKADSRDLFAYSIRPDPEMPTLDSAVEGIGFKEMRFTQVQKDSPATVFTGCLTRRHGRITEFHDRILGRTAVVSFPIFGGMSGGPVLRLLTGSAPVAFGFLSKDIDDCEEDKYDQTKAGATTVIKIPFELEINADGLLEGTFRFRGNDIGIEK